MGSTGASSSQKGNKSTKRVLDFSAMGGIDVLEESNLCGFASSYGVS